MALPIFQSDSRAFSQMQTQWGSQLNPLLSQPIVNGRLVSNVSLSSGNNTINHLLGRTLIGWIIVRQSAAASIFDNQASNSMPDKTLILNASAPCVVSLWTF